MSRGGGFVRTSQHWKETRTTHTHTHTYGHAHTHTPTHTKMEVNYTWMVGTKRTDTHTGSSYSSTLH